MQLSKPLTKRRTKTWMKWAAAANVLAAACVLFAADPAVITIASKNLFPESITSTTDGAIIIGSFGTSTIWRIPPGENNASQWIDASKNKGPLLGVLADEKSGRLLVCQAGVKTFDLKTGAPKEELIIPTANPFCNDLAVRDDGSLFVTDTVGAKVFMFAKGSTTPFAATGVEVASDPLLAGADGLAFLSDPDKLYVNTVTSSKLLRLDLAKDGKVTKITELKQSRPLLGPDGMRPIDGKRLIIAEGKGRTAMGVPDGDSIAITTLKEGGMEGGTPAVTVTKGMGWTMEGKLQQRDAKNPDADKGPFRLFPVPLPK
jgi:sugar lactone lactonase YvrE